MENHDIDKIFKEGLEKSPKNQYQEEHWAILENKLNQNNSKNRKLLISWFSAVAGIAAIITILMVWNKNRPFENPKPTTAKVRTGKIEIDSVFTNKLDLKNQQKILDATSLNKEVITFFPKQIRLQGRSIETKGPSDLTNENLTVDSLQNANEILLVGIKDTLSINHLKDTTLKIVESFPRENLRKLEEETLNVKSNNKGNFTVLAALDMTEVRGAEQSKLSQNIGLLYTQPLTKSISVSTGAIYSKKNYDSPYSFYNPKNPYKGSHEPTNVSAVCDVISVPILLNYQIYTNKNIAISLSSGVSSYFMLKERYNFIYDGEGYKPYTSTYTLKGKNQHYFGVADFSINFDRKINNKFTIGLRPFVQIPLTGIGFGRTNLQSKGLAISFGILP